jgi:hypothetical protein
VSDLLAGVDPTGLLRDEPRAEFSAGVIEGAGDGLWEWVEDQIAIVGVLLKVAVDYLVFVQELEVTAMSLYYAWVDREEPTEVLEAIFKTRHPQLWSAIQASRPFMTSFTAFAATLQPWTAQALGAAFAVRAIARWIERLPETVGQKLRPHLESIVAAKGDPEEQGRIIGRVAAPVILEIVLTVIDVAQLSKYLIGFMVRKAKDGLPLLAHGTELADDALKFAQDAAKQAHVADELAAAATHVDEVAPALTKPAQQLGGGLRAHVVAAYGEFSYWIGPHRITRVKTGGFNARVRELEKLAKTDPEFAISLRFDSSHIVGGKWFDAFPDDFKRAFKDWEVLDAHGNPVIHNGKPLRLSWESADDMDTMGWHTEAHIRSPERLAEALDIDEGKEALQRLKPLENEMNAFFQEKLTLEQHGVKWPFQNAGDVIRAHKHFYREKWGHPGSSRNQWLRLERWFERAEAAWEASLPKP